MILRIFLHHLTGVREQEMGFFYSLENIKKRRDGKGKDGGVLSQSVEMYFQSTKQWHGAQEKINK